MRIAMIILSILSLVFIGVISWSIAGNTSGWGLSLRNIGSSTEVGNDAITLETWKNQIKTDERLERLTVLVEEMAKKNGSYVEEKNISTLTGAETYIPAPAVKPSGKLLALLMPTVTLELEKNNGIYGLYTFDASIPYSTYKDPSIPIVLTVIGISYETFLKNMKSLGGKPYSINEVKSFPFRAFFVNSDILDASIRLVVEMEGQSIALETPKTRYELLKNLLLGKGGTNIKSLTNVNTPSEEKKNPQPPKIVKEIKEVKPVLSTGSSLRPKESSTGTTTLLKSSTRSGTTIRITN